MGNVCFCASFLKQSERDGQALVRALVEFSLRRNNSERIGSPRQAYHHLPWQEGAGEGEARQESTQRLLLLIFFPSLDNDFNWQRVENSAAFIFAALYRDGMLIQSSVGEIRLLPLLMQASY